jgi:succinoglycan biosynthesis protein ExoM
MSKISKSVSVAICIATYKRPRGLRRLLVSLRELKFYKSKNPDWQIVIVDNDASMPTRNLIESLRDSFSIPLIYGVEPERGIASARNRAVQLAGNVDFIAFIDDDEVAESRWLDELLSTQNKLGVDIVNGPVIPRFEQPVPPWVLKGCFYNRRRFTTGTKIKWANTGNVLIKTCWLHAVPGPFNKKLNFSGGEDTLFFSQVYRMGAKMIWADEAIVEEFNPPSRVSANWILMRAFRAGNGTSICEIAIGSSFTEKSIRFFKSVMHVFLGFLLLVPESMYRGYAGVIRSLMHISFGMGGISGLFGKRFMEYKSTHGN